jgi:hypothetical protein
LCVPYSLAEPKRGKLPTVKQVKTVIDILGGISAGEENVVGDGLTEEAQEYLLANVDNLPEEARFGQRCNSYFPSSSVRLKQLIIPIRTYAARYGNAMDVGTPPILAVGSPLLLY